VADRPVTIVLPDGYELASAQPQPSNDDGTLTYDAGTEFDGFEVVAERPTGSGTDAGTDGERTDTETTGGSAPGFGVIAALVALAAVGLLARAGD
jgi:PGF-CTERM protein